MRHLLHYDTEICSFFVKIFCMTSCNALHLDCGVTMLLYAEVSVLNNFEMR